MYRVSVCLSPVRQRDNRAKPSVGEDYGARTGKSIEECLFWYNMSPPSDNDVPPAEKNI
ncbi:Hypothetical protein FKW44_017127 [Caligus rogercresseyi]|uniref:Uncharacterized protein n=1 Tax=Caligus rogercresseyi TaxID=217165 RepID=A0A7T8H2X3_CALRO|nr:Hypothetical protein FKW44_017127 [Caligus rogercresseyi]